MQELKVMKDKALGAWRNAGADGKKLLADLLGAEHFKRDDPKEYVGNVADVFAELDMEVPVITDGMGVWNKLEIVMRRWTGIMKVFNGGWVPNMTDTNQRKWYAVFNTITDPTAPAGFRLAFFVSYYDRDYDDLGVRPYFKDDPTLKYVVKYFLQEYELLAQVLQEILLLTA